MTGGATSFVAAGRWASWPSRCPARHHATKLPTPSTPTSSQNRDKRLLSRSPLRHHLLVRQPHHHEPHRRQQQITTPVSHERRKRAMKLARIALDDQPAIHDQINEANRIEEHLRLNAVATPAQPQPHAGLRARHAGAVHKGNLPGRSSRDRRRQALQHIDTHQAAVQQRVADHRKVTRVQTLERHPQRHLHVVDRRPAQRCVQVAGRTMQQQTAC